MRLDLGQEISDVRGNRLDPEHPAISLLCNTSLAENHVPQFYSASIHPVVRCMESIPITKGELLAIAFFGLTGRAESTALVQMIRNIKRIT